MTHWFFLFVIAIAVAPTQNAPSVEDWIGVRKVRNTKNVEMSAWFKPEESGAKWAWDTKLLVPGEYVEIEWHLKMGNGWYGAHYRYKLKGTPGYPITKVVDTSKIMNKVLRLKSKKRFEKVIITSETGHSEQHVKHLSTSEMKHDIEDEIDTLMNAFLATKAKIPPKREGLPGPPGNRVKFILSAAKERAQNASPIPNGDKHNFLPFYPPLFEKRGCPGVWDEEYIIRTKIISNPQQDPLAGLPPPPLPAKYFDMDELYMEYMEYMEDELYKEVKHDELRLSKAIARQKKWYHNYH